MERALTTLPSVAFLPPVVRTPVLNLWYFAVLWMLASVFLCVVLPLCTTVGVLYGVFSLARTRIFGAAPGRYIEEANLKRGNVSPLQRFLVLNRSPMVLAFVLPLSRFYQLYTRFRTAFALKTESAPHLHAERVEHIQKQFQQWKAEGGGKRIATARPGWQRVSLKESKYKDKCFLVRTDRMTDILEINTEARWVSVEPMVTMGQLVPALMEMGWTLPVVPELEELTVGGMIAGTGVESSSHHSGLFQEFCLELEVVLASGAVVKCSKSEREDLFEAFFWSYGTLGMLVSAKLRIIPSAPYIRLCYYPFDSEQAFVDFWRSEAVKGLKFAEAGDDVDLDSAGEDRCARFVEGLVFSEHKGVVMLGDFAHKVGEDGSLYEHGKWHQKYFYKHALDSFHRTKPGGPPLVEYIPLRDYYYRHSRSVFWEMENIVPLGDSALFRWAFGWMLPPSVSFLKVTQPASIRKFYESKHVIQDMLVPVSKIEKSLEVFRQHFDMYPLWVCPMYLRPGRGIVHAKGDKFEMYVDLGAYGVPGPVKRGEDFDVIEQTRKVEDYVASVDGFEMLYADSFMTRKEFAKMFDRGLYDELRKSLGGSEAFPDIYDKIVEPRRLEELRERLGDDLVQ
uniref:Delta(24)-sterol reductase n=1 Tax=Alexandrium catenella TaxID=2925 RepID=A0A7S1WGT0_ALECA